MRWVFLIQFCVGCWYTIVSGSQLSYTPKKNMLLRTNDILTEVLEDVKRKITKIFEWDVKRLTHTGRGRFCGPALCGIIGENCC